MASSFSDTVRQWLQTITAIFKQKPGLDNLSLDDIRKQKISLEQSERKVLRDLEKLEREKTRLFEAAKQASSQTLRLSLARKLQGVDQRITQLQHILRPLGARISVLGDFESQYELGRFARGSSEMVDALRTTDAQKIQEQVDESLSRELLQQQKVNEMLETFTGSMENESETYDQDEGLQEILKAIETASLLETEPEQAADLQTQEPPTTTQAMTE